MATRKKAAAKDPVPAIEKILGDADALIRHRMKAIGLDVHHVILAVTRDGTGIICSNVPPDALVEMAYMLEDIAEQEEAPPRRDDTQYLSFAVAYGLSHGHPQEDCSEAQAHVDQDHCRDEARRRCCAERIA